MMKCNKYLQENKLAYPRTCAICKLGPCQKESERNENKIHFQILKLLKDKSESPYEYIHPVFLSEIRDLLSAYYGLEDEKLNQWINERLSD
jgi:hypothetical protein